MVENLLLSLKVVSPLFLLMALGALLRRCRLWDSHTVKVMNNVTFRVFLSLMLFVNITHANLADAFSPRLAAFGVVAIAAAFLLLCLLVPRLESEPSRRGVLVQGIYRSNFIIFGLPLTVSLFGQEAGGITSLLIAVIIPIFNLFAVLSLEMFRGGRPDFKKILKGIVTNPLIIGAVAGLLVLVSGLRLPAALDKTASDLAAIATPLALMILGASFEFRAVRGNIRQLVWGVAGKLLIMPGIFLPIAIALGFRGAELSALLAMFASPTAVSSFTMAQQMEGDADLAGQIVVFSSGLSVVTVFLWVFFLKQLGFL